MLTSDASRTETETSRSARFLPGLGLLAEVLRLISSQIAPLIVGDNLPQEFLYGSRRSGALGIQLGAYLHEGLPDVAWDYDRHALLTRCHGMSSPESLFLG